MIIRNNNTNRYNSVRETILKALEDSVMTFYLTGSRYFGLENEDSDWDFFIQDGPNVSKELSKLGFLAVEPISPDSMYSDHNTARVYYHGGANIHVQVSKDAILKNITQRVIKANSMLEMELRQAKRKDNEQATKIHSRNFWNYILTVVKSTIVESNR